MSDVTCAEAGERSLDVVAVAASLADDVELANVSAELGGVPLAQVAQEGLICGCFRLRCCE